jgi:protein involved in polysaccharide export with SLBB domain
LPEVTGSAASGDPRQRHALWVMQALGLLLGIWSVAAVGQEAASEPLMQPGISSANYALSPGDKIRISVFNQPDLSGEFELDREGRFSMPLVGTIEATGLTPAELESHLVGRYKPDYLVNPRIFIQILNARVYYLVGEVRGTGAFPYVPGMTYLTAIANAGGFTYRAKKDVVYVVRGDDPRQEEIRLSVEEEVRPGDIVRIGERLF